jgi:hypothetical protein
MVTSYILSLAKKKMVKCAVIFRGENAVRSVRAATSLIRYSIGC